MFERLDLISPLRLKEEEEEEEMMENHKVRLLSVREQVGKVKNYVSLSILLRISILTFFLDLPKNIT